MSLELFTILPLTCAFFLLLIKAVMTILKRHEEVARVARSLELANLRLQELDKQKTDFLSIAAHQLRTPLAILGGYIELLKDGGYGQVNTKMAAALEAMDASNNRLITLVDDFLDITRIEQGRLNFTFVTKDIRPLVLSVVNELTERAEQKGLQLVTVLPDSLPDVRLDEEKIRHVIFNLVDNAIKYSLSGTITITADVERGMVVIQMADQGLGFTKIEAANFFQKFYRGTNVVGANSDGTGLGLYVCRRLIEAHHGRIWAASPGPNAGSQFTFALPL